MNNNATLPLTYADLLEVNGDMTLLADETMSDLQNLEQDVIHIIQENPNSNLDDPDRGIGIGAMLSGPSTQLTDLTRTIQGQLLKDSRVQSCTAALVSNTDANNGGAAFTLNVTVQVAGVVTGLAFQFDQSGAYLP